MAEATGEDLYSMVTKNTRDNDNSNLVPKVQFGYSVDNYKGVLAALQQAQAAQAAQSNSSGGATDGGSVRNPIFARWTEMGSINVTNAGFYPDGFVVDGSNDFEKYRQQRVRFLPFMSFVVESEDEKKQKKPHLACFNSNNTTLNDGISVARGAKLAFPPYVIDETVCDKLGVTVGGMSNSCEFGVAVDLTDGTGTPDAFFNKCYNKIYKVGMGGKLAARRALMVEIAFVNGTTANTLHARVIANSGKDPSGTYHSIYIPIPILLIDEFDTLADVYIETDQQKKVGSDVNYPFKSSYYNHLDASLSDFTPQYLKDIAKKQLQVPNCNCSFHSTDATNQQNYGYIRFYIDKEKEAQIKDCLSGEIPTEYRSEIFKGIKDAKMGEKVIGYSTDYIGSSGGGDVYWDATYFSEVEITKEQYEKCIRIIWDFEVGTPNADWRKCEDVGDRAGLSYGPYQYTEKSGLLGRVVRDYLSAKGEANYNDSDKVLSKSSLATEGYSGTQNVGNTSVMNALKAVGDDPAMKTAQGKLFLETRVKTAIQNMKACGMTSALGLQMWLYYINHGYNKTNYINAINSGGTDEASKCTALANAHESRLRGLWSWEKYKKGWLVFLNAHRRAISSSNFDLSKSQKWRVNTF